jgi:divalent metal cation (Fe/Co/Zn/Cd) transporter
MPDGSTRTVLVAIGADLGVALAKVGTAVFTGSSAVAAGAAEALADTANDVFLLIAQRRGSRLPDDQHPLGYGREAYFWALIAALGVFVAGAAFSLREGIDELIHPSATSSFTVAYAVLAVSAVLDLVSFRQSGGQMSLRAPASTETCWRNPGSPPTPPCGLCSPRTRYRSPETCSRLPPWP